MNCKDRPNVTGNLAKIPEEFHAKRDKKNRITKMGSWVLEALGGILHEYSFKIFKRALF
jgi:hypothetical protein